jgi:RNA polymerase sigma-70 factor (ECF subfamily)
MNEALAPPFLGTSLFSAKPRAASLDRAQAQAKDAKPSAQASLEPLIGRLQSGDDSALEAFIEVTKDMAYRLAFSILGEREQCQDVLQEVYLTVYQKIGQLREPAALRGWFSQIVINRCRQELRGRRLEAFEELPEHLGIDGMAANIDLRVDVQEAMRSLPSCDQAVLTMREVCQLSYQEIAETLKLPLGTVRSRLFNARQRLLMALSPKKGIQS